MIIYMHRGYASMPYCARCSAAFFRKPMGTDRPCVTRIVDDGREDMLHFVVTTDNRTLEFDLTGGPAEACRRRLGVHGRLGPTLSATGGRTLASPCRSARRPHGLRLAGTGLVAPVNSRLLRQH